MQYHKLFADADDAASGANKLTSGTCVMLRCSAVCCGTSRCGSTHGDSRPNCLLHGCHVRRRCCGASRFALLLCGTPFGDAAVVVCGPAKVGPSRGKPPLSPRHGIWRAKAQTEDMLNMPANIPDLRCSTVANTGDGDAHTSTRLEEAASEHARTLPGIPERLSGYPGGILCACGPVGPL